MIGSTAFVINVLELLTSYLVSGDSVRSGYSNVRFKEVRIQSENLHEFGENLQGNVSIFEASTRR